MEMALRGPFFRRQAITVAIPILLLLILLFGTLGIFVADAFFAAAVVAVVLTLALGEPIARRR